MALESKKICNLDSLKSEGRRGFNNKRGNNKLVKAGDNELRVLIVNESIRNANELTKLIKNAWLKEYNECNWMEGSEKMNKFNKLVIKVRKDPMFEGNGSIYLNENIYNDIIKLGKEITNYARESIFKKLTSDKEIEWLRNTALDSKSTLKDKVESCSILIQSNPILYIKELDILKSMILNASNKTSYIKMMDVILNMMLSNKIIPKNRELSNIYSNKKLETLFSNNKIEDASINISMFELVQVYFENYLKEWYLVLTNILIKMLNDTQWTVKKKMISLVFHLCLNITEQRHLLINALVHKFGDREDKVASHSTYLLGEIIRKNENSDIIYIIIDILSDHLSKNLESFHNLLISSHKKKNRKNSKEDEKNDDGSSAVVYRQVYRLMLFISEIKLNRNYNFYSLPFMESKFPPPIRILNLCLSSLRVIVDSRTRDSDKIMTVKEPIYRFLRVTLNCINRSLPYAEAQIRLINNKSSNKLLENFETQYIPKLYFLCHNIDCGSIRIVILNVLYRISKILNVLSGRYYRLFYSQLLYRPIYNSKNKKLLVYLTWKIINDDEISHTTVISILKRAIQVSIHNYDIPMLLSFLIIVINIIINGDDINRKNIKKGASSCKKRKLTGRKKLSCYTNGEFSPLLNGDNNDEILGEDNKLNRSNLVIISNSLKDLITRNDSNIAGDFEDEHFVDISEEENDYHKIIYIGNDTKSDIDCKHDNVNNNNMKCKINMRYDPLKRDPNYSNGDNIHFWELDMLRSFYHPLIAEIAYKCLILCNEKMIHKEAKSTLSIEDRNNLLNSIKGFIRKFRLNYETSMGSDKNNVINKLFKLSSLPLFLQILNYNMVDLNLILLKCFDNNNAKENAQLIEKNSRINSFNKWNSSYVPEYLNFYKLYFEDGFVKSINKYNKLNSDMENGGNYDEDNFDIDYDETTGKMIKHNKYKGDNNSDVMIDSLIDDFSNIKQDEEDPTDDDYGDFMEEDDDFMEDDNFMDDDSDIDIMSEVNMEDIPEHVDLEANNDLIYLKSNKHKKQKVETESENDPLNTITYVDADEMEDYLS
ncbi:hypothetical protein FG379_000426 [Cryptosporidium bovis]|uniref:uncharacterized protein n=1 Tax=Cryptosporidium bovis TaxID=310047 RepID=UPI003519F5FF|nr:hypothetical protein FG379_000426 [Cryptosporidium bovis]